MGYKPCYAKNIDTESGTYCGKQLAASEEYLIPDKARLMWASDGDVLTAITSGKLQIGTGVEYLSSYSDQINWLKSDTPLDVIPQLPSTGGPFTLVPDGLVARRIYIQKHCSNITLSNKDDDTFEYDDTLLTPEVGDRIFQGAGLYYYSDKLIVRPKIIEVLTSPNRIRVEPESDLMGGTYVTLGDGEAILSKACHIDYQIPGPIPTSPAEIIWKHIFGFTFDCRNNGFFDWAEYRVIDTYDLLGGGQNPMREHVFYDESFAENWNNIREIIRPPDMDPGPVPQTFRLRVTYYCSDPTMTGYTDILLDHTIELRVE